MHNRRRVHFVLSTHWDREWYQSFQDFRFQLVRLMDQVLEGLESGDLIGPFQTDGQSIVLEDYLEVRPECEDRVKALLDQGKLVAGPWYVLPDEFTISGESIIRNLRHGRQVVRDMGGVPSNAGFMCDMFGHISQMPQIMAGFGITGALIWRGVNILDKHQLIWHGADGTEMPSIRFGKVGYCDYAIRVRRALQPEWKLGDEESFAEDLDKFVEEEALATDTDALLVFDGGDHQGLDQDVYRLFKKWMNWEGQTFDVQHTDLDQFLAEMVDQADRITTHVTGELREPGLYPTDMDQQWLIPGVLSSRVWMKQANHQIETMLCHWAEPLSSFLNVSMGEAYAQGYLNLAWRWLMQNHTHDSIDGCSIDQVHRDMRYRFDQSRLIADRLALECTQKITANIEGKIEPDELRVTVFNPLPRPFNGIHELTLAIPPDWPTFNEFFGYEPKPAFRIFDDQGTEIPYQRLSQRARRARKRIFKAKFTQEYTSHDVRVAMNINIPAMGYTTLSVRKGEAGKPTRYPTTPSLVTSERSMENEYLRMEIETNGSLRVTDLRNGNVYTRALIFEDIADIGDGWYHGQAVNDQSFSSTAAQAEVAIIHNGPYLATFRIKLSMPIPEEFDFAGMQRSERRSDMTIDNLLTLRKDQDYLEVQTTVTNQSGDHRLRVLFPSGAHTDTSLADSAFDVVERPISLRSDNHLYRELEVETRPQQSWTAVSDETRGLAVVADGLLECAVPDVPERPIALTLFRATRRTVMTNGEEDGQLFGKMTFNYLLAPIQGKPDRTRLTELGIRLSAGLRDNQQLPEDQAIHLNQPVMPAKFSFFELTGPAIVTSSRMVSGGFEIRLYNPLETPIQTGIEIHPLPGKGIPWDHYQLVNLESNPISDMYSFSGKIDLEMDPKKIFTLRLT